MESVHCSITFSYLLSQIFHTNHTRDIPLSFGFTGYLKETIPQLYFTGSREYNTRDGRFQSKDQYRYMDYQDPLSINLYAYTKANPLKYLDYDGHECIGEKSCMERILEMLLFGGASDEAIGPGLALNVWLSFTGLDYPRDIHNLAACFKEDFCPSDPSWWQRMGDGLLSFLPITGGIKFLNESGLLKYIRESIKVGEGTAYNVTLESEFYLNNESIPDPEVYWNRQDGYFSGSWWLDEEKKQEALNVLVREGLLAEGEAGGYDLMTHYMETEPGSAKRYALQLMFQLEPIDGDDEIVLNNIAGACARNGIDLAGNGWVLPSKVMMLHAEHHEEMQAECDMNEKSLVSFMLNFMPVVGEIKSVVEAISGKDTITQEELSDFERVLGLAAGFCDVLSIRNGITGGKKVVGEGAEAVLEGGTVPKGTLTGKLDGLTADERGMVEDLLSSGKNVEIIPRSDTGKTPDFFVDGVKTELKTLNGSSLNTPVTRIEDGFEQGAEVVIIDGRKTGLTLEQAETVIVRALGKYDGELPGIIEIWTKEGIVRR